ncbi:hypothetical protein FACS189427_10890 [Planctomycetales bacterium]|nr:hypothetical protein FACS189427_10890 [Planctomycetales bacterium]
MKFNGFTNLDFKFRIVYIAAKGYKLSTVSNDYAGFTGWSIENNEPISTSQFSRAGLCQSGYTGKAVLTQHGS